MRHFELTIGVFMWDNEPLPETFEDWLRLAFGDRAVNQMGASPTTLKKVIETRHPPADDVIERRRQIGMRVSY